MWTKITEKGKPVRYNRLLLQKLVTEGELLLYKL